MLSKSTEPVLSETSAAAKERLVVQTIRVGTYLACLFLVILQFLLQRTFYDWSLLKSFYLVCAAGLAMHVIPLWALDQFFAKKIVLGLSFAADVILVSLLLYTTELNESIFLFMYLVNILLSGLVFGSHGSVAMAALTSIAFTLATLFGPEVKSMSFLFLVLLNNFSFFAVAWLSGYLAAQLSFFSQRLQAQNLSLTAIRRLNEMIIETIPSGLLTINSQGQILQCNPGASAVFAIDDLVKENIFQLLPGIEATVVAKSFAQKQDFQYHRNSDSSLLEVQVLPQLAEAFTDETFLVIVEDLTQIKRFEFAVRQSEKMAAVGQLAAGIAHEIRNPLAGISGSIELLSQTSVDEDDKKLTKIILKEINRLNNLISEFLEFAKPEKPPVDPVDLRPLVRECLDAALAQSKKSVELQIDLQNGEPIRAHRDKLKQAFLNIFINAIQAMESVPAAQLLVRSEIKDHRVWISIKDNGCGMKEETRRRMFEAFHTTKPKGTGLGLAITHKILESHGGQIFVSSELGLGTEFVISFPRI